MKELLYIIVGGIAKIHEQLLTLNNSFERSFSDKELHFLVMGILGMALIFVIYPLFKSLARSGHIMTIAWIYVFTLMVVITFAVEIGQQITGSGAMEFADIMFGLVGFMAMFLVFAIILGVFHFLFRR
ncbi:MAG: hypothetical protein KBS83_03850 [Lachnospiraceae bacterium]|nr:hypothetical protein [Candidatus Equihabitans merdae]